MTSEEVQPANGKDFKLEELQKIVGGFIELVPAEGFTTSDSGITVVPIPPNHIIVLNEEGKLLGLPYNYLGSLAYGNPHDFIVGTVLLCQSNEVR